MNKTKNLICIIVIVALVVIDQAIKLWIKSRFNVGQSVSVIDNFFSLTYVQNSGAAFGILRDRRYVFLILSTVIIAGLFVVLVKSRNVLTIASICLIIAGAIGNMIDRLVYGYVVDMFDFHGIWKYVFNFADVCVVCGVIMFSILTLLEGE